MRRKYIESLGLCISKSRAITNRLEADSFISHEDNILQMRAISDAFDEISCQIDNMDEVNDN